MESKSQNIGKVFIIAEQFLLRLGIKTIINVLGIKPEVHEVSALSEIKEIPVGTAFIIIDSECILNEKDINLNNLKEHFPNCRVLVLEKYATNPSHDIISVADSQQEILDKFQRFFFEEPDNDDPQNESSVLSDREIDVLKEVSKGYSNKEIADRLFISINTVITHRKNITEKLEIKTIAGLTVYALMNKLIRPEDSQK